MTYLREMRRCLKLAAAVAIAGSAFFAAPAHAATVILGTGCSGSGPFTYTGMTVDGSGNVTVNCSNAGPGTVGFNPTSYSVNTGQNVTVNVARTAGTSGAVGANLSISGGCTLGSSQVNFADGVSTAQSVTVTAPGSTTTCTVNLAVTGGAVQGTSSASVNVTDPNVPGTFTFTSPNSTPVAGGPNYSFQISRGGGSNGSYDVGFTATPAGLTGASIVESSPIRFLNGETTKTLTLVPGSSPGTMVITFTTVTPVAPTTVGTTFGGPITLTVGPGGTGPPGCPAPPTGSVPLSDMPATEGPLVVADLQSGVIGYSKLNTLPASIFGATVTMSSTGGSGNLTNIELGLSPCPGDITYGAKPPGANNQQFYGQYNPCYVSSPFITNVLVNWHLSGGSFMYCYAPQSQAWYVNIRYVGSGRMFFQWNRR